MHSKSLMLESISQTLRNTSVRPLGYLCDAFLVGDNNALIQPEGRELYVRLLAQAWTDGLRRMQPGGPLWTFWD